jgi:DnaJ family protein C protein 14
MDAGIDEEFFEWLQNAMQSGAFETSGDPPSPGSGSNAKSSGGGNSNKKKRKGKKQW